MNSSIRLHIPGIPYTLTREEYSHDAFTAKVLKFSPMMRSLGFEVFHYGVESSISGATQSIDLMSLEEWKELRLQTIEAIEKVSRERAEEINTDPTYLINTLSNWDSPLCNEFCSRFKRELKKNYRSRGTDLVCIPLGKTYAKALSADVTVLEIGIGYNHSCCDYRVFESHTWMASVLATEKRQPHHYWFVIPHFFNTAEFALCETPKKRVGFLGRLVELKGLRVFGDIAREFPDVEFVMCGQGKPGPFLRSDIPNLIYEPPIHGKERSEFLGSCVAFLHPCLYLEPFGCAPVEAQLCGTPVICSDWGGMSETVEQFKTGLRCHTLADYIFGIKLALQGKFDRKYIRDRAVKTYDMYTLAHNYEYAIKSVLDIHAERSGVKGWYSKKSFLKSLYFTQEKLNTDPDVDMIYYINLDRRPDRNSHMINQFINEGIDSSKITRFSAVDGTLHEFTMEEECLFKKCIYRHTPSYKKIMGNQLSHFNIYKDMLSKNYTKILILQDDAILAQDFTRQLNLVANNIPPDGELVNLGLHKTAVYSSFEAYDLSNDCDAVHVELKKINDYVCAWKSHLNPCSLAYLLTSEGAKNLIAHFSKQGFLRETDHSLNDYLKTKNIFYGSRKILTTGNPSLGTDIFDTPKWWS